MRDITALSRYIDDSRLRRFQWGVFDCASFAAGAVNALVGVDYFAPMSGYASEFGAAKKLSQAGYYSIEEYVDSLFNASTIYGARNGDLVLCGTGLGVVWGGVALAPGDDGLLVYPIDRVGKIWRVDALPIAQELST